MNRIGFFGLLSSLTAGELTEVQMAYWVSKNAHRPQAPRDTGERYFEHPREVAVILIERGYKSSGIIARALLHDVVEDTNTPFQVITELFGHELWQSLVVLSKYIPLFDPVTGQVIGRFKKLPEVYFGQLAEAPEMDRLVKLADRVHNLRSMETWSRPKKVIYAEETRAKLIPIAEMTDLWFARELETLSDKQLES